MSGDPDGHGIEAGAGEIADGVPISQWRDQGQGARPEGLGELQCPVVQDGDTPGGRKVGDMGDQRVETRPALGLEDTGDSQRVTGVGRQAVDGLGREGDELSGLERADSRL